MALGRRPCGYRRGRIGYRCGSPGLVIQRVASSALGLWSEAWSGPVPPLRRLRCGVLGGASLLWWNEGTVSRILGLQPPWGKKVAFPLVRGAKKVYREAAPRPVPGLSGGGERRPGSWSRGSVRCALGGRASQLPPNGGRGRFKTSTLPGTRVPTPSLGWTTLPTPTHYGR